MHLPGCSVLDSSRKMVFDRLGTMSDLQCLDKAAGRVIDKVTAPIRELK